MRPDGQLIWFYSLKGYPEKIRRIRFYDAEQKRTLIFLTNNMLLQSDQIASLYKNQVEDRTFLQMDQATPAYHLVLGTHRKCSQNAGLYRGHNLYPCGDH